LIVASARARMRVFRYGRSALRIKLIVLEYTEIEAPGQDDDYFRSIGRVIEEHNKNLLTRFSVIVKLMFVSGGRA
jgi:hypothetical protein